MTRAATRTERPTSAAGQVKQLAGHSVVYGLGGLASKLVGIFLLPVYAHRVSQEAYGEVELIMAAVAAAAIALRLGLPNAMFRFSFERTGHATRPQVIQTTFTSVTALSTVGLAAGLALSGPLSAVLDVGRTPVIIGLFGLWVTMNYDVLAAIYRIEQRPTAFVAYSLLNVGITIVLSLVFVIPLDLGAVGIMLGNFSGSYVVYALLLYARRDTVGIRRSDRRLLRRMLDYGLPLMPAGLMLWALNLADRFQVQRLASPADLGSYSAAAKISTGVMLAVAAFQTAWAPFAHSILDDREARQTYRLAFSYWAMAMCWALVAIALLTPPYVHLTMPRRWWDAAPVVPLLMSGGVLYGAYMVVRIGANRAKRNRLTPALTAVAAGTNVGLNFVLIPAWGIVGAGVSTVAGYAVLVALGWKNAQAGFTVSYDWGRILRVSLAATGFVAASVWLIPAASWLGIVARLSLIPAFPLALVAVGALKPGERASMLALFAQARRKRRSPAEPAEAEPEETELAPGS